MLKRIKNVYTERLKGVEVKSKEIKDLLSLAIPEMRKRLISINTEIKKIEIERKLGKLKNTNLLGAKKKDIARLKTFIKIKETLQ